MFGHVLPLKYRSLFLEYPTRPDSALPTRLGPTTITHNDHGIRPRYLDHGISTSLDVTILYSTSYNLDAQMGPSLRTRGKGAGYVDLRHVLFGDHPARKPTASLSDFLLRFVASFVALFVTTPERTERHVQHDPRPVKLVASTFG